MRVTIEIPDDLAAEANRAARDAGTSLHALVLTGLRNELDRRSERPPVAFSSPTQTGLGLVVGLAPTEAIARSYEGPA